MIKNIMVGALLILFLISRATIEDQQNEIDVLTEKLQDTQEQLLINNDRLKQIQMYQEREQYMEDE